MRGFDSIVKETHGAKMQISMISNNPTLAHGNVSQRRPMARMRAQQSCGTFKDKIWESHGRIRDFLTSAIRFYLELKKDPHGPETALFVGNMPPNLSQRQYEDSLLDLLEEGE